MFSKFAKLSQLCMFKKKAIGLPQARNQPDIFVEARANLGVASIFVFSLNDRRH